MKDAAVPTPFALPVSPAKPASVETVWVAMTMARMMLLLKSATYALPALSTAMPTGHEKVASVPTPLAEPMLPLPARVATAVVATPTVRIRLLNVSLT